MVSRIYGTVRSSSYIRLIPILFPCGGSSNSYWTMFGSEKSVLEISISHGTRLI